MLISFVRFSLFVFLLESLTYVSVLVELQSYRIVSSYSILQRTKKKMLMCFCVISNLSKQRTFRFLSTNRRHPQSINNYIKCNRRMYYYSFNYGVFEVAASAKVDEHVSWKALHPKLSHLLVFPMKDKTHSGNIRETRIETV